MDDEQLTAPTSPQVKLDTQDLAEAPHGLLGGRAILGQDLLREWPPEDAREPKRCGNDGRATRALLPRGRPQPEREPRPRRPPAQGSCLDRCLLRRHLHPELELRRPRARHHENPGTGSTTNFTLGVQGNVTQEVAETSGRLSARLRRRGSSWPRSGVLRGSSRSRFWPKCL